MASVTRSRVLPASSETIWEIVSDAYALPRWWPRLTRVESVSETGFTEVLYSRKGRPVRLDHSYTAVQEGALLAWELEVPGSPFERMISEWGTQIRLEPEFEGTLVSIEERQSFRGSFRTGTFLQRRASKRRLSEALDGLEDLLEDASEAGA